MRSTEYRLLHQLADHITNTHPGFNLDIESFLRAGHQMLTPTEPCNHCGNHTWRMIPAGTNTPIWLQLAGRSTTRHTVRTAPHTCDNDLTAVAASAAQAAILALYRSTP